MVMAGTTYYRSFVHSNKQFRFENTKKVFSKGVPSELCFESLPCCIEKRILGKQKDWPVDIR